MQSSATTDRGGCLGSAPRMCTGSVLVFAALAFSDIHVLYVGNSYTNNNGGVYSFVRELDAASSVPVHVTHNLVWEGGQPLRTHWDNGYAVDSLNHNAYDYMVIQPFWWTMSSVEEFHHYLRLFDSVAVENGTETILFQPWPFNGWKKDSMYDSILDACESIAKELGLTIARVAEAWNRSERLRPDLAMYTDDKVHPTYAGSYLAACCIYIALTGKNPTGVQYTHNGTVSQPDAEFLQQTAWVVMNATTALEPGSTVSATGTRQKLCSGSVHNVMGQRVTTPMSSLVRGLYVGNAAGDSWRPQFLRLR